MSEIIKDKTRIATEQQFLFILSKVVETFPQYTLSQHLAHVFRRKVELQQPYFWSDALSLRRMEEYYDELVQELATFSTDENEY